MIANLVTVVFLAAAILYFAAAGIAYKRQSMQAAMARALMVYTFSAGLWALVVALGQWARWPPAGAAGQVWLRVTIYGVVILAMLSLSVSEAFLHRNKTRWFWGAMGGGGLALLGLILFESPLLPLPAPWDDLRSPLTAGLIWLEWGIFTGAAILFTARTYRRTPQPLHRNRLIYWALILSLTVLGDLLFFIHQPAITGMLRILAAPALAYVALSHRLPDVRRSTQRIAGYLISATVMVLLYLALFAGAFYLYLQAPRLDARIILLGLALLAALLFNPLQNQTRKIVQRLLSRAAYDPSQMVREYSLSISNILDLERLTAVAIGLIHEAMPIQRGALFLVDFQPQAAGQLPGYHWRGIKGLGVEEPGQGRLAADSPLADYLRLEHQPLTQYDIDLLPRFRGAAAAERAWLNSLGIDVYVPIYAQNEWIGLLALGPKLSHERYYDDDLNLLSVLADQTAVGLQNARLVENLRRLNRELDGTNQLLAQMDHTKSEFIDIVSHELLTPLTLVDGYSQLLLNEPIIQANQHQLQLVEGMHGGATRMHEIIATMLDMAKIDTRSLTLQADMLPVSIPIQVVVDKLRSALTERKLTIELKELNKLPLVEADQEALHKVFYHLLNNAIKYTPNGGRITVSGQAVPPAPPNLPDGGVEVVVSDTGIGIDPRNLELIFHKFYQTGKIDMHSSGKTKFKGGGPGLGLTIARGIVEAHGGRLWAESPGHDEANCPGSNFHILLPVHQRHLRGLATT